MSEGKTQETEKRGRGRPPTTTKVKAQCNKAWLDGKRYAKGDTVEIQKPRVDEVTVTGVWKEA